MTQKEMFEQIRALYVASEILFFLNVFKTNDYEKTVLGCETKCREQIIDQLYHILIEKNKDYKIIMDYLKKCTNGTDGFIGMKSLKYLNPELCASNIIYDVESLDRPIYISKPSSLFDDF